MLQDVALTGTFSGKDVDPKRINAARILLAKVLPDMAVTKIEGGDEPLTVRIIKHGNS